jgi:hypothetical protein
MQGPNPGVADSLLAVSQARIGERIASSNLSVLG